MNGTSIDKLDTQRFQKHSEENWSYLLVNKGPSLLGQELRIGSSTPEETRCRKSDVHVAVFPFVRRFLLIGFNNTTWSYPYRIRQVDAYSWDKSRSPKSSQSTNNDPLVGIPILGECFSAIQVVPWIMSAMNDLVSERNTTPCSRLVGGAPT